jgi:hypothetical protein
MGAAHYRMQENELLAAGNLELSDANQKVHVMPPAARKFL